MRKIIFILMSLFSLGAFADNNINGGFVVAPILAEGYAAYGDWLAPSENGNDEASYISGTYITIIGAQTATDIKSINVVGDKTFYNFSGNVLKVYSPASLYSLDGKRICCLKANTQIVTSNLPGMFILKFKDGSAWKLQK